MILTYWLVIPVKSSISLIPLRLLPDHRALPGSACSITHRRVRTLGGRSRHGLLLFFSFFLVFKLRIAFCTLPLIVGTAAAAGLPGPLSGLDRFSLQPRRRSFLLKRLFDVAISCCSYM